VQIKAPQGGSREVGRESTMPLPRPPVHRATYTLKGTAVASIIPKLPEGRAGALFIATAALVPAGAANQTEARAS
jgi:hypothetical protein